MDFGAGKLNGAALARMVRLRQAAVKIVFIARGENREYATELGEFLPIPLNPEALVDAVGKLLVESRA